MTAEHTPVRAKLDEVAAKVIDGEAVLINLATGIYYSMRGSGAYLWSHLMSGATLDQLIESVVARYGIDRERARVDTKQLVDTLTHEGLVVVGGDPPDPATPAPMQALAPDSYETPQLDRFDDMADMFALDPPLPELPAVTNAERA